MSEEGHCVLGVGMGQMADLGIRGGVRDSKARFREQLGDMD